MSNCGWVPRPMGHNYTSLAGAWPALLERTTGVAVFPSMDVLVLLSVSWSWIAFLYGHNNIICHIHTRNVSRIAP